MVAIERINGTYYLVKSKMVDGKRKKERKSLGRITKREANILRGRYEDREQNILFLRDTFQAVYDEFEPKYRESCRRERTFESFESNLRRFLNQYGGIRIVDIGFKELLAYVSILKGLGLSNRTINIIRGEVFKVFNYALRTNRICVLPIWDRLPQITKPQIVRLSEGEVKDILERASSPLREYITVMLGTGMRPVEFRNLTWDDVSFSDKTINIISERENKRGRKIPVSENVMTALRSISDLGEKTPYPWDTYSGPKRTLKSLEKELGLKLNQYVFRKTFFSIMATRGVSRATLAEIGGTSAKMLESFYVDIECNEYRYDMNMTPVN